MRLLIVEDEVRLADTLRQLLYRQGYTADVCHDGVSGLDNALTGIYDLVVLDVMLPGMNGFQVAQKLRAANVSAPVLMLTAKSSLDDRVHGLDCGADDYIAKPFGIMEFLSRVRVALRRSAPEVRPDVLAFHEIQLDNARHSVTVNSTPVELTYKEYCLLRLLLENTSLVVTRETILQVVWGTDISVESRTVDMHIRTLRQKLGVYGEYIETVRSVGYRWRAQP